MVVERVSMQHPDVQYGLDGPAALAAPACHGRELHDSLDWTTPLTDPLVDVRARVESEHLEWVVGT